MEGVDDARGQPPHVGRGHMGALGDLEGVESDEVDGGDLAALERGRMCA